MNALPLLAALASLAVPQRAPKTPDEALPDVKIHAAPPASKPVHPAVPASPPVHHAEPASPPVHRGTPAARPSPPPRQPSRPAPVPVETSRPRHHHHRDHRRSFFFGGAWVPVRVYQGVDEQRLEGPGAITPIEDPDPVDPEVVGNWRLELPYVVAAEDGYGRVDTLHQVQDLGGLIIRSSGDYEWDVPGRLRSTGQLVEVTASDAGADEHFWAFEGNGRTMVIAPGPNGTLILYDAGTNQFYARARR